MNLVEGLINSINDLEKRVKRLETQGIPRWVFLAAPLTSTSWDSDAHSTTAKTKIDLSSVFSAPAGIKAVLFYFSIRDSASSGGDYYLVLSPNDTAGQGMVETCPKTDDEILRGCVMVPCDSSGDIYYQVVASGASTFDIWLQIWGYLI